MDTPPTNDEANTDELFMEEALRAAQRALEAGEVPIGAVVVHSGKIVGRGGNRNLTDSDPTAHAEIVALRQAGAALLARAQAAGEVRDGVDIDDLVRMVQAVTLAAEESDDPDTAERLFGFVLDGVRAR